MSTAGKITWGAVSALIGTGAGSAAALGVMRGDAPLVAAGGASLVGLAFVLWRRFW